MEMDHYTFPKMMEEILLIACTIPITERLFHLPGKIFGISQAEKNCDPLG
jgi:hypothetical protein